MVMQGTKKERWVAVYGAAYVRLVADGEPTVNAVIGAVAEADGAIAAEPEERPLMPRAAEYHGAASEAEPHIDFERAESEYTLREFGAWVTGKGSIDPPWVTVRQEGQGSIHLDRSEAAALSRLLLRFAETGEL